MTTFETIFSPISAGRVLDVATGPGSFIHTLIGSLKSYDEIIGVDNNPKAEAAFAEAASGVHGGVRYVLDLMADRAKARAQEEHADRVLTESLGRLGWEQKVALSEAFLRQYRPLLSAETVFRPPEQCAARLGDIFLGFSKAVDSINEVFRRL